MKIDGIPWRKIIVYAIYILLIPSIQVTLSSRLTLWGQTADLMLVFAVLTGFVYGFREGLIAGILMGLMRDVLAAPVIAGPKGTLSVAFGIGMLVLFLGGAFGAVFFEGRTNRNLLLGILAVSCYTVIYKVSGNVAGALWSSLISGTGGSRGIWTVIRTSVLPSVLMNAIAAVIIFILINFMGPAPYRGKRRKDRNNKELTYGESGNWLTI